MKSTFGKEFFDAFGAGQVRVVKIAKEDIVVASAEKYYAEYDDRGWNCTNPATFTVKVVACPELIRKLKELGLERALWSIGYYNQERKDYSNTTVHRVYVDLKRMRSTKNKNAKVDAANAELDEFVDSQSADFIDRCRVKYAEKLEDSIASIIYGFACDGMKEMIKDKDFSSKRTLDMQKDFNDICERRDELNRRIARLDNELKELKVQERLDFIKKNIEDPEIHAVLENGLQHQVRIYG